MFLIGPNKAGVSLGERPPITIQSLSLGGMWKLRGEYAGWSIGSVWELSPAQRAGRKNGKGKGEREV